MKTTLLKIIGVALFIWVLSKIDLAELAQYITSANWPLLGVSFFVQYLIYAVKTVRWHIFVRSTEVQTSVWESWKLFNIGIFFANITPGKLGEFGKSAYLITAGVPKAHAVGLIILDRLMDIMVILVIAIVSIGILFGWVWSLAGLACASLLLPIISWIIISSITARNTLDFFGLKRFVPSILTLALTLALTLISWSIYFVWAILLARSIGIDTSIHVLIAAFTLTGILSLLPIAPSGLGTRDLALLTLLAPYGVEAANTVALAMLMFISILLSSTLGGWYALRDTKLRTSLHEKRQLDTTGSSSTLG